MMMNMSYTLNDAELLIIKELIRKIFENFNDTKNNVKLPKKTIQKILFRLNKKLPSDSHIKNAIPFYWFLAGPYSEKIDMGVSIMKSEQLLLDDDSIYELYKFNPDSLHHRFLDHNNTDLQKAREIISNEIKQIRGFSNLQLIKEVYEDAPLLFYPSYKSRFLVHFESFCNYHLEQNEDLQILFSVDDILESLEKTKLSLPTDPIFEKFNEIYKEFVIMITKVLDYDKKNDSEFLTVLQPLANLANMIWNVFAHGARILEHDDFYQSKIQLWNKMFNDQTTQLEENMSKISALVTNVLHITLHEKHQVRSVEDKEFRQKLARSLGMDKIPDYDPKSFDRLTGIIAAKIKTKNFDSVELVREARGG
jgi:hypothetical protein